MLHAALTPLIALALTSPAVAHAPAQAPRERAVTAIAAAASGAGLGDLPGFEALGSLRGADLFPPVISLPDGFAPEGVALGYGPLIFAGSTADGSIWRGDAVTGRGEVLVPGEEGRTTRGLEIDQRGRLWVAGGPTGAARVYDGITGEELASYQLVPAGEGFINDVVVTRDAAYFTDSRSDTLQVVPIGKGGKLGSEATALPLSGDLEIVEGFNLNGIETTPDGKSLLAVQSATGLLFRIDKATGVTSRVAGLDDGALSNGDGLLRDRGTLYVVRNSLNEVAVLNLDTAGGSATITETLTDDDLNVPTTIGLLGPFLYAVNARLGTEVTPTTTYDVVRITRD